MYFVFQNTDAAIQLNAPCISQPAPFVTQ